MQFLHISLIHLEYTPIEHTNSLIQHTKQQFRLPLRHSWAEPCFELDMYALVLHPLEPCTLPTNCTAGINQLITFATLQYRSSATSRVLPSRHLLVRE